MSGKYCCSPLLGIAPNTMLAKVCSDRNKPNGQYLLPPDREAVVAFIQSLPVRKVRNCPRSNGNSH